MFNNCIKIPHDWQHKQRCSHRILPRDLCRALRSAYSFSSVNCRRCSSCTDIATMQPHSPDSSHLTVSVILLAGCRQAASASISVTQWPTISILHPVGKKLYVGSKIDWHLSEWARRHLSPCKVRGEIEQCAPAVAAKIWCMYVFCHAPRPVRCSFEGDVLWTSTVSWFMGWFSCCFHSFFQNRLPFQRH